jgi:ABC-type transporter Mla maintaining outer membrane lipid asymmetry permease subunit MlaE
MVLVESFIFGVVFALIACGWGLTAKDDVKALGKLATAAVATS